MIRLLKQWFKLNPDEESNHHDDLQYNPFLNHIIITRILSNLGESDLLKTRQLNREWHWLSTRALHTRHLTRSVATRDSLKWLTRNASATFPIQTFTFNLRVLDTKEIPRVLSLQCIHRLTLTVDSDQFEQTVHSIRYMQNLTHLRITRIPEHSYEFTNNPPPAIYTPTSLRSCVFKNGSSGRKNFLATYDTAIVSLLRTSPSLEYLRFTHWSSLTKIFKNLSFDNLKYLVVNGSKLSETDVIVLINKHTLLLHNLTVRVDKHVEPSLIKQLVSCRVTA